MGVPDVAFTVRILPDAPRSSSSIDLAVALGLLAAHDVVPSNTWRMFTSSADWQWTVQFSLSVASCRY